MKRSLVLSPSELERSPAPAIPLSLGKALGELRAINDAGSVPYRILKNWLQDRSNEPSRKPLLILIPGFGTDARYLKPLQVYLSQLGYCAEGWGLGVNRAGMDLPHRLAELSVSWNVDGRYTKNPEQYRGEGGVPFLCDRVTQRVRLRAEQSNRPIVLIGWSLGGYVAREVARELSQQVVHVITMGAPVIGGPKYTRAASTFESKGYDLDWIETEVARRDRVPIQQPITAIFSKTDGVVDWRATLDKNSPNVSHIEVDVPHLGMGFNKQIWGLVKASLKQSWN